MSVRSSRLGPALVTAFLLGCGGGTDPVPPNPPPPPPPPGPPASIAAHQGDGQAGAPGSALPTRPAVIVKDASARAVPGVAVTFAVDSGGGTIASGQVTTGTDGVATAGDWTLGSGEGRNVLRITAGNLPALTMSATATIPEVAVGQGQTGLAGGTIRVAQPGSALDGLTISIPDSAFTSQVSFTVRQKSSFGLVLPAPGEALQASVAAGAGATQAGTAPVTPVITIVTTGPAAAAGEILLQIPVPAGTVNPVVAVVDGAGKPLAFLTILSRDSVSVTVSTRVLSAALLAQVGNIPQAAAPPHSLSIVVFKGPVTQSLSTYAPIPFGANYVFGKHDLAYFSFTTSSSFRIDNGMALVEYASFYLHPNGVHHAFDRAKGVTLSDTPGIMLSAGVTSESFSLMGRYGPAFIESYRRLDVNYDRSEAISILHTLSSTRGPVPVWLTDGFYLHMVLVIGWNPARESFTVREPNFGVPVELSFAGGVMAPYTDPFISTIKYTTAYLNAPWVSSYWAYGLANNTLALASASTPEPFSSTFRGAAFQSRGSVLYRSAVNQADTVFFLADTTRVWPMTEAPATTSGSNFPVPAGWGHGFGILYTRDDAGIWDPNGSQAGSWKYDWSSLPNGAAATVGLVVLELDPNRLAGNWAGWREIRLIKFGLSITELIKTAGTPSTFTPVLAPGSPALPSGATFEWDFGDGKPTQTVTGLTAVTHTFDVGGAYNVVLRVIHPSRNIPIARVTKSVNVGGEIPFWRITTFADQDDLVDLSISSPLGTLLGRILAVPNSGLIAIDDEIAGGRTVLRLRVLPTSIWDQTTCCPVPLGPFPGELQQSLGVMPEATWPVGPHFAGWGTNRWAQSTTSLAAGTLTGQYVDGLTTYVIEDVGTELGPRAVLRITATRTGAAMSGMITVTGWFSDDETGFVDVNPVTYRLPFTAVRMQ